MNTMRFAALLAFAGAGTSNAAQVSFHALHGLPGSSGAQAFCVTADGYVVGGESTGSGRGSRWVGLGDTIDLFGNNFYPGRCTGITSDGLVMVGTGMAAGGTFSHAYRWTPAGPVDLGSAVEGYSRGVGVSHDGTVVVGACQFQTHYGPALWKDGAWLSLGSVVGVPTGGNATGTNTDGSVVVGWTGNGMPSRAFVWTPGAGMMALQLASGELLEGSAYAVSGDGSIVAGEGRLGTPQIGTEAFVWTASTGLVGLGDLPGGFNGSGARGISADGTTVVGWSGAPNGLEAFVWRRESGIVNLRELLVSYGVPGLTGWTYVTAEGVSADGTTIVGWGTNPGGDVEGWKAVIPRPCAADFNHDAQLDFFDYLDFVRAIDAQDPAADFNRDGTIDFLDYLDFVAAFDAECE
jgi:probable HAF family extracellular repeat protein